MAQFVGYERKEATVHTDFKRFKSNLQHTSLNLFWSPAASRRRQLEKIKRCVSRIPAVVPDLFFLVCASWLSCRRVAVEPTVHVYIWRCRSVLHYAWRKTKNRKYAFRFDVGNETR